MLSFLVQHRYIDRTTGIRTISLEIVESEAPALEAVLTRSGWNPRGTDTMTVIGTVPVSTFTEEDTNIKHLADYYSERLW